MTVGQAYKDSLTPRAQEVLAEGCDVFIDQCFEALRTITGPQEIEETILALALPERYTPNILLSFFNNLSCV